MDHGLGFQGLGLEMRKAHIRWQDSGQVHDKVLLTYYDAHGLRRRSFTPLTGPAARPAVYAHQSALLCMLSESCILHRCAGMEFILPSMVAAI